MKKSKLFLVLALAVVVVSLLSLAACGGTTTTSTVTSTATTTATTTATATTTKTSTVTASATSTPTKTTSTTPVSGGTLRIIWSTSPSNFGWGPLTYGGEGAYASPCMETLYTTKFSGELVPQLATAYSVAADGLSITYTLRSGVKFHDGTTFDATAVKYNFDAMIAAGRVSTNLKSVDAVDATHVKFNLVKFKNTEIDEIAGVIIASPTFVQKNGATYAGTHCCGTGPFKEVSYDPGVKIRMERFDDYWGQKAYLDAIESTFVVDPMTQVIAMQAGQGDVTHSRVAKTISALKGSGFNIITNWSGMEAACFDSANAKSPFADVRVRQAVEYAINKQAIIDALGYGYWQVADQFAVSGQNGYLSKLTPRTYNVDKAKALLAAAGYTTFSTHIIHATGEWDDASVAVQDDLKAVGITADIQIVDFGKLYAMRQQGWDGIMITGSGLIADDNNFLDSYFRAGSTEMLSIARPAGFQDLIDAAVSANPADNAKTQAAMQVMFDQCMWAIMEHHGDDYAYTSKVHGLDFGNWAQWGQFSSNLAWMSK